MKFLLTFATTAIIFVTYAIGADIKKLNDHDTLIILGKYAMQELAKSNCLDFGFDEKCVNYPLIHQVELVVTLEEDGDKKFLLMTATKPINSDEKSFKYTCHACSPASSFFLFKETQKHIKLERVYLDANRMGAWGEADVPKVIAFDKEIIGLLYDTTYVTNGESEQNYNIYVLEGKKPRSVLSVPSGYDNGGRVEESDPSFTSWSSKYKMFGNKLIITSSGIRDGLKFKETNVYIFDGKSFHHVLDNLH